MAQEKDAETAVHKLMADEGLTYDQARKKIVRALAISLVAAKAADADARRRPH